MCVVVLVSFHMFEFWLLIFLISFLLFLVSHVLPCLCLHLFCRILSFLPYLFSDIPANQGFCFLWLSALTSFVLHVLSEPCIVLSVCLSLFGPVCFQTPCVFLDCCFVLDRYFCKLFLAVRSPLRINVTPVA